MKNKKHTRIALASITFLCFHLNLLQFVSIASDITIETYVEGGLTISLNGDWSSGLVHDQITQIEGYEQDVETYWSAIDNEDYIDFVDDTNTNGFYLTIEVSDLVYSGEDQSQGDLSASKFKLYGNYTTNPLAGNIGENDPTKTISILPESCTNAVPGNFSLHNDFSDINKNYALSGSNTAQIIMESSVDCLVLGHLRFDKTEISISSTEAFGSYQSDITLTIIDGSPV